MKIKYTIPFIIILVLLTGCNKNEVVKTTSTISDTEVKASTVEDTTGNVNNDENMNQELLNKAYLSKIGVKPFDAERMLFVLDQYNIGIIESHEVLETNNMVDKIRYTNKEGTEFIVNQTKDNVILTIYDKDNTLLYQSQAFKTGDLELE